MMMDGPEVIEGETRMPTPAGPGRRARRRVFLAHHLFTERDRLRFDEEFFSGRGYATYYLSCWNLLRHEGAPDLETSDFKNVPEIIVPRTRAELGAFLDTLEPVDFIVVMVGLNIDNYWLFRALADRGLRYSTINLGKIPSLSRPNFRGPGTWARGLRGVATNLRRTASRFWLRLRTALVIGPGYFKLKAPLMEIRGGVYQAPFTHPFPFWRRAKVVDVTGFEIAWARRAEREPAPAIDGKYAVFLSGGLGDLPDTVVWNVKSEQNRGSYYADLRRTFDKIERDLDCTVVIALHPKHSYTEAEAHALFGRRPTFQDKTASLVRGADLLLVHFSTAMGFAAIYRKPIIFLTNAMFRRDPQGGYIDYAASWFGQEALDMGTIDPADERPLALPQVRDDILERYRDNFLEARGARQGPIWPIVAEEFEALTPESGSG